MLLLIATRPVPILAEVVAATAGAARMNWWRFLLGAGLGTGPICLLYGYVGSRGGGVGHSFAALAVAVAVPLALYAAFARPWMSSR